jgi:hypothetical protein
MPDGSEYRYDVRMCAWCGSFPHKPDCKALAKNSYPVSELEVSSLTKQRLVTNQIRRETQRVIIASALEAQRNVTRVEPPDTRTEVQKRFDAIAEELKNGE